MNTKISNPEGRMDSAFLMDAVTKQKDWQKTEMGLNLEQTELRFIYIHTYLDDCNQSISIEKPGFVWKGFLVLFQYCLHS